MRDAHQLYDIRSPSVTGAPNWYLWQRILVQLFPIDEVIRCGHGDILLAIGGGKSVVCSVNFDEARIGKICVNG